MSDAGALTVVAARGDWLCGLDQARALRCFESNLTGSLRPTSNEPRIRPEIEVPIDLVVGNGHGCVRDQAGQVGCFDDRFAGGFVYWVPPEGLTAVSLAAGTHHVCAIRPDRSVTCWGANTDLQLGAEPGSPVAGLSDVREVAPGALHTCAVRATGEVWCWGDDRWGQLGRGEPSSAPGPAPVPTITDARSIAAGHSHTCVVHADGTVSCWGRNLGGELGAGAGDEEHAPRRVPGLVGVRQLVAGFNHTCAVLTTGAVTCFGLSNTRSYRANLGTGAVTETTGN
jgi:alpha-tubulin suppressor-like RCC1 family protein